MIQENPYVCGSNSPPAEALFICKQKGCQKYAFTCGRKTCDCKDAHAQHDLVYIDSVLAQAVKPIVMPARLVAQEKKVNELIDGLVSDMMQIKEKHQQHIKQFMEKQVKHRSLRDKLAAKEKL